MIKSANTFILKRLKTDNKHNRNEKMENNYIHFIFKTRHFLFILEFPDESDTVIEDINLCIVILGLDHRCRDFQEKEMP